MKMNTQIDFKTSQTSLKEVAGAEVYFIFLLPEEV